MNKTFFLQLVMIVLMIVLAGQFYILRQLFDVWKPFMQAIEEYRAEGTIQLIEDRILATPPEDRMSEFALIQAGFGYKINLSLFNSNPSTAQVAAMSAQQSQLQRFSTELSRGEIVFNQETLQHYKKIGAAHLLTINNMDVPANLSHSTEALDIEAGLRILAQAFSETPKKDWPYLSKKLSLASGLPIMYEELQVLPLDEEQKNKLTKGIVVLTSSQLSDSQELPANLAYHLINGSTAVLRVGPIAPQLERIQIHTVTVFYTLLSLFVTLPIALWFLPTWLSARRINTASRLFGQGKLNSRIQLVWGSHLNSLSRVFNLMATNTQQAFDRNKMLAHAISHELRTPLTNLGFTLELLANDVDKSKRQTLFNRMDLCLQDLNELSSELDVYARFNQQELHLDLDTVDINQFLSESKQKWQLLSNNAPFTLTPWPATIRCKVDRYYLNRAIDNLVRNAARHAKHRIHIYLSPAAGGCCINIENDGTPIADDDKLRIFEPFVRLEESRTRDSGGTGLGLAIVAQIINAHNGRVWAEDADLGGAKLVIYLPTSLK